MSTKALVPKITQPWKTRYSSWLEINDSVLGDISQKFMNEVEMEYGRDFDTSRLLETFLRFVYKNSSSRRIKAQRRILLSSVSL